jgi:hypothetical protein
MSKRVAKPKGNKQLWIFYSYFNKTFWDGKMPVPMVLVFDKIKEGDDAQMQFMDSGSVRIRINRDYRNHPDMAAIALLHEMIHVSMGPDYHGDHGTRFQAEKHRLFMAGAYDQIL